MTAMAMIWEEEHVATKTLRAFRKTMEDYVYVYVAILLVSYYF